MTTLRQIEANRRNAAQSTGPITSAGKRRSRQNAFRHGLCAETVIGVLEDVADYRGFEAAVIADFNVETAVERELVLRLASLLWRIRRTVTVETALFQIEGEALHELKNDQSLIYEPEPAVALANCFQRLVNLKGASLDHLARYERSLSRQIAQTLSILRYRYQRRRSVY